MSLSRGEFVLRWPYLMSLSRGEFVYRRVCLAVSVSYADLVLL